MNELNEIAKKNIENLIASCDRETEKRNAEKMMAYARENYISYQVVIYDAELAAVIELENLSENIDEKIKVIISITGNDLLFTWAPINNSHIYILFRE